ncbi:helix-turn-helix domain-containing protein [uncultured Oscillibacter sp.]|uniref:helix-turn-helix domain-containing protein n=1 Tax=uncultured Oscillibacter sp. TaxID=876091 RepID=UPI00262508D0|nr:helix-turn-helix domain-containing protein [uncultured Oscillibacter sp.]
MSFKSYDELPVLLTVSDLADVLQVSRNKAYSLARSRSLCALRVAGQIRIEKQAFLDYIQTLKETA